MLKKTLLIILILFLSSFLIMHLFWRFEDKKNLNVLILDKTVLESKTQEHISISWLLTNERYLHSKKGEYNHKVDYFGFFPNDSGKYKTHDFDKYTDLRLDSLASSYDMAYYTDLYGIYTGEWYEKYPNVSPYKSNSFSLAMEHTRKIYGGMTKTELSLLQKMKAQKKLIVTEFNVIASPTPGDIRRKFEKEFGMEWTGWVGRYYETLDTIKNKELPRWLKQNYRKQHNDKWPFKKSGIVFVNEDLRIEILENITHLKIEVPIIYSSEACVKKYGVTEKIKYPFWFDIIKTSQKNEIMSSYKISPNKLGRKLLQEYGIPEVFPAAIEHDSTDYKFHYFAGDFCDNPIGLKTSKFKYIEFFSNYFYHKGAQERVSFFWEYYRPMMKEILSDYYKETAKKEGKELHH